jgi:CIC family chloride channel protein
LTDEAEQAGGASPAGAAGGDEGGVPLGWARRWHSRLKQTEHVYMVLISVVLGLLGGLGAVGFRKFIQLAEQIAWQAPAFTLEHVRELPIWWKVAAPAGGGLIVGVVIYFFAREAKGHGVPEVMEAIALRGGRIRARVVAAKLFASGVCIGSGGSVGREGPIVQIGASLGSAIGQWLGIGERRLRTLVGCGAAAGIAGTFNAPVAGALFAAEVILGDFAVTHFSPIVISSVAATVVSRMFLGDSPAFEVPAYSLVHPAELLAYAVLGVLAGLVALLFVRALYATEDLFDAIRLPDPFKAAAGGAAIGIIGIQYPEIFGVGYEAIDQALRGQMVWNLLLVLVVVKILAVSLTIGSGGSGGIFAPSLFIGAMVGGTIGTVVHGWWPEYTGTAGAYALVGMGAVVAAGTHAPITAIVIIFELTSDYKIILPLMISCILATLLAMQLQKASIYTMKLLRRGFDISGGQSINVLAHLKAEDVLREETATVAPEEPLMPVITRFMENPGVTVFVVDHSDRLHGVITVNEIRPIMDDLEAVQQLLIARDLMRESDFPVFTREDRLDEVMLRFGNYRFEAPVVEDGKLVGTIWPQDVIQRYNAEVFKRDMASSMSTTMTRSPVPYAIPGIHGMSMVEINVPAEFVGRTVAEVDVRGRFDTTILLLKRRTGDDGEFIHEIPEARSVLREGDVMLVMGREENLRRLERLS